jgi:cell division cycle protein 20 (cofactor of APC complex)
MSYIREQMEIDECMDFNTDVSSNVVPRWKRKAMSQAANSVASSPMGARKQARRAAGTPQHDRFIPNRGAMDLANAHFNLLKENNSNANNTSDSTESPTKAAFKSALADNLGASKHRVLAFRNKAPAPEDGYQNSLKVLYTQNKSKAQRACVKPQRHIPSAPERILDAPDLLDDYYLNLIDWSSSNFLAVALGQTVYLWNAESGAIEELCQTTGEDDYISSVNFVQDGGGYLAVGTNSNQVQLWDVESMRMLRTMDGHQARVGSLAWNQHVLSSGSRDSQIIHHDVRIAQHQIATLHGHEQEVCGLKWSPDGQTLASGGNDNLLCLWDARGGAEGMAPSSRIQAPRVRLSDHNAAVKALAWCPYQRNVLASGGGTADRTIKLWNSSTGACLNSVDTGSQVCSLLWNPHEKELLSSHGFSENQLCLWKYPSMVKTKELTGHTSRVLHLAASPDGTMVCSAAADETLRFWKCFDNAPGKSSVSSKDPASASSLSSTGASGVNGRRSMLSGMNIR